MRSQAGSIALLLSAACMVARDPLASEQPNDPDTGVVAAGQYRAIDLGTLGGAWATPTAINEAGQIVGVSATASGASHAFLWQDSVMHDLGTLRGGDSEAHAINARGQVAGASVADGTARVFLWDNGTMRDLGPDDAFYVLVRRVDDHGDVVATIIWADGRVSAVRWHGGVMQDLGGLDPAAPRTNAYAAHESGLVVGQSVAFRSGDTAFDHPFLWDGTQLHDLGALGTSGDAAYCVAHPCSHGLAVDVNAARQVVGWSTDDLGIARAFLWEHGAMRDLGGFAGLFTWALSVNAAGQIVGEYTSNFHTNLRGFIWEAGAVRDLGSLGGERTSVLAINDEGLIAGSSHLRNGAPHGFVWRDGRMYDLGAGLPTAMNERGDIVGVSSRPPAPERGVLWRRRAAAEMVATTP